MAQPSLSCSKLVTLRARSLSGIALSTAANDARPSASFSARKNPQRIPANTLPVFPSLRPRIWPHLLCLVTKGNVGQAPRALLPLPSSDTILWHRQCNLSSQQLIPIFKRWHMAQESTAEDQVIDSLHRARACDLEEVTRRCPNLTWNQVFLVVDHLSRTGRVRLVRAKGGSYTLTLLHRQGSRPDQYSLSS